MWFFCMDLLRSGCSWRVHAPWGVWFCHISCHSSRDLFLVTFLTSAKGTPAGFGCIQLASSNLYFSRRSMGTISRPKVQTGVYFQSEVPYTFFLIGMMWLPMTKSGFHAYFLVSITASNLWCTILSLCSSSGAEL